MPRISFLRDRRFALVIAVASIAVAALVSFGSGLLMPYPHPWFISGDVWATTDSAQYLSYGGIGSIYSINPFYSALPGFLALFAPVVALGDHFGLVPGYPFPLPRPSMWLVAGPFFFLCGATAVPALDYLAQTLGVTRSRRRALCVSIALLVVVPTAGLAGHPEDMLALALSAVSVSLLLQGRMAGAAVWLSLAILMQTWAGLLIPVFLAASPAGTRLRTLLRVAALPAAVGIALLALDWPDASMVLLHQPMTGQGQHLPWWSLAGHITTTQLGHPDPAINGSSPRFLAVAASLVIAWLTRRNLSPEKIMLSMALVLFARGLFETEFWPYYLAPAAVFFALLGATATVGSTRRFAAVLAGAGLLYGCAPLSYVGVQYPAALALMILLLTGLLCVGASFPETVRWPGTRFWRAPAQAG